MAETNPHSDHGTQRQGKRNRRWIRPLLNLWYVHPDVTLLVYAPPAACLGLIATAAKPSTDRLHLRNLFAYGRRYHFVRGSIEGFRMVTTSKIPWRKRGRTRPTATLDGTFQSLDDNLTQIHITAQIHLINIGASLLIPIIFTPIFLFASFHPIVRVLGLIALYGFAWVAYRYNAAMDAHDIVYFIEQALDDFMPKSVSELGAHVPHVVDNREDFPEAWEKFYQAHQDESEQ